MSTRNELSDSQRRRLDTATRSNNSGPSSPNTENNCANCSKAIERRAGEEPSSLQCKNCLKKRGQEDTTRNKSHCVTGEQDHSNTRRQQSESGHRGSATVSTRSEDPNKLSGIMPESRRRQDNSIDARSQIAVSQRPRGTAGAVAATSPSPIGNITDLSQTAAPHPRLPSDELIYWSQNEAMFGGFFACGA
ncbi:hypothetical protein BD410DRAFT_787619 [Rickenella mellea]|uniref:Uncharacterized protein n=1 Tax=Rickenella mellea TaxID=50990 RepID=A0A4Y7Q6U5_9AGAM|nr:hypothetical protein BD410DRAFT_787619 [Rickenella mellea]